MRQTLLLAAVILGSRFIGDSTPAAACDDHDDDDNVSAALADADDADDEDDDNEAKAPFKFDFDMEDFAKGIVDSRYLAFESTTAALALFVAVRVLQARRYEE